MKKIGILSDTHAYWDDRYITYFTGCDEIWHAGDIGSEDILIRLRDIAPVVRAVRGNIDGGNLRKDLKDVEIFTTDGIKVLMTHIGGYPGKYAPGIKALLLEHEPQIFVAGHSHILKVINDPWLHCLHINPGAAGRQGWQVVSTLVLLTIDKGAPVDCQVVELSRPSYVEYQK